ncbi:proline racemase [Ktedonosporobacter rubrisoli]|uniref:Proline racemase n=1 Tax=Ktedonosporobacter rubrisoli TaxID=2509675 RepID=A0A4P6K2S0_KTERU|nr:proline racemase family protein [Ktedonosporobacter rubrisoli]QBD82527.1 proline racemase [Ktedonosporobacter rubrisoli]
MRFEKMLTAVDSHTEGMPTRIITSGFGPVPGSSMFEKMQYIEEHQDQLRGLLMNEPRGHLAMNGAVLLPPCDPEADLGVVYIDVHGYLPMCGHGTIGTCTVAIETRLVPPVEPITHVTLDTPAGRVVVEASVQHGRVKKVKLRNVPAFLYRKDVMVEVPDLGCLTLDIAYGGNFYGILPAEAVGLTLESRHAQALIECGMKIMQAVQQQVPLQHPLQPGIKEIKHTLFTGPAAEEGAHARNTVVIAPGVLDRSPCGTGTSARMAQLFARGQLPLQQDFVHESIIGTRFTGRLLEQVQLTPDTIAVIPTVEGRAWITGFQNLVLDPEDPCPAGFILG